MFRSPKLLVKKTGLRAGEGFDTVDQILASSASKGVSIQMDLPTVNGLSVQTGNHLDVHCWPFSKQQAGGHFGAEGGDAAKFDYLGSGRVIEKMIEDGKKTKLLLSCGGLVAHITTPTPHDLDALQVNEKVWIGVNKV